MIVFLLLVSCCPKSELGDNRATVCDYPMCRYEKENVDTVIIEHAKESRVVMFGEIHDSVLSGSPPPIEDSRYVISLLPELMKIGYSYLALEVNSDEKEKGHSRDMVRFYNDCMNGKAVCEKEYACAKPGWIELLRSAMDLGYSIRFIDTPPGGVCGVSRDREMFKKIKSDIFERDEEAKIIVYIGANHVIEQETYEGIYSHRGKRKPLGLLLDDYTKGKNYSVYMGHTYDTPAKCDLFISFFIWDTFKNLNSKP